MIGEEMSGIAKVGGDEGKGGSSTEMSLWMSLAGTCVRRFKGVSELNQL